MFKKSRRKIILSIMAALILVLAGTLGIIYGSSLYEMSGTNGEMLERYVELYSLEHQPGDKKRRGNGPGPATQEALAEVSPAFQLSTFYSVAISDTGEVLATDNNGPTVYSNENLIAIAESILAKNRESGVIDSLIYRVSDKGSYTLIAFMDNTIQQENVSTLFHYTLIFGGIVIIVLFCISIYLARKIVQPLEDSYQKQKQFISDAGHELKTPVSVISANVDLLSRKLGNDPWLANIQYENERMGALVSQLLELARTENVSPQMEILDFSRLTRGEALPFESVIFENGLHLKLEIADSLFVSGNAPQLKQLVSILLDNAVRYCQQNGSISLTLRGERNTAVLSVVNDGEEIPKEQREQLFERFYRVDPVRNGNDRHYGLGLAIAKAIITSHKGKIEVHCCNGKVDFIARIPLQKG